MNEEIDVKAIREKAALTASKMIGVATTAGWELSATDAEIIEQYTRMKKVTAAFERGCACGAPAQIVTGDGVPFCSQCGKEDAQRREAAYYGGLANSPFRKQTLGARIRKFFLSVLS